MQFDLRRWDYKHQVLKAQSMPPWRVFLWFKTIEVLMQARPRVLGRTLFHRDPDYRHAMRWYTRIGGRVWFHEALEFIFKSRPRHIGPTLREFMGETLAHREYALAKPRKIQKSRVPISEQQESSMSR